MSIVSDMRRMEKDRVISPPPWMMDNLCYLTIMGSEAYGSNTEKSDKDIYGFCMNPKNTFLHSHYGLVFGFDNFESFDQWQEHGRKDLSKNQEYDFTVYGIINYIKLLFGGNPNIIDSIFTPRRCVVFSNPVGELVRNKRHMFLSKQCFQKMKMYGYSQLKKLDRNPEGKRKESYDIHGYDLKFASHLVRLILQCEQILVENDLDLERNREVLKSIRRGEWSLDQVKEFFFNKESVLEKLYHESNIQERPNIDEVRKFLIDCLEHHYGSLEKVLPANDGAAIALREINKVLENNRKYL